MKQRLGLADVLIREPEVIILDEPTLGIDPSGVKEFLAFISHLSRQQSLTVLLSSHHLHQVQQVCDRVGIFVEGKLLVQGNIETLSRNLFGEESVTVVVTIKELLPPSWEPLKELQQFPSIKKINIAENSITFSCTEDVTPGIVRFMVEKGLNVTGVHKNEFGLDEIYQRYFEDSLNKNIPDGQSGTKSQKSFFKKNKL
jgi:ABC-2 type transport system ATP-binding protein